ncbi:hypothetical protein [Clostridium merdae]|uniref:hypothetical protein n=1 Tax=Clostridium merdae TaxID=1958780 RepID=UPI001FA88EC7|nr:hypothetical protein [Clostridium merdae]
MMDGSEIKTPRGEIIITKAGRAQLVWSTSFKNKWPGQYSRAQQYVDSEVLRLSTPLIPIRSSMLIKSGQLGTVVGSGHVSWIAPYARNRYYNTATSRPDDRQRGAYWFERMKAVHGTQIVNGAKRMAGGGGK